MQELVDKQPQLPEDIRWHLIGHLQRNKVKYIAPFVHLIHSVDSRKLLREINKQGEKNGRILSVLFQFHIAAEESKFGCDPENYTWIGEIDWDQEMPFVRPCGVMGMATFTDDEAQIRGEFRKLKAIFDDLKLRVFSDQDAFLEVSMGMSSDYLIALEEGATIVRVGSVLFGPRGQ